MNFTTPRLTGCLLAIALSLTAVFQPLSAQTSVAGNDNSFTYVEKSPLDGKTISTYVRDVNSSNHYFLKNNRIHVNFSTVASKNNQYGSIRPGTAMDVMLVQDSGYVDCLDWTEMILVPSSDITSENETTMLKTWDWDAAKRNISLPSISAIRDQYVVASGVWEGGDSIKVSAIYTLIENEPIMRIELTLKNSGKKPFLGLLGYIMDHDLGNQYCYLPGKGWGKSNSLAATKSGWTSNYVYEGTDLVQEKSVPVHGIAWDSTKTNPYAVLYPGYISGVWFNVAIPSSGIQKITYYHIVTEPDSIGTEAYKPMEILAEKVIGDTYVSEFIPTVSGLVLDKDGVTPVEGAKLVCRDITSKTIAVAKTDKNGYYSMLVPIGTYTTTSSCIGYYKESRSIEIEKEEDYSLDLVMDPITNTNASYDEDMNGILVEGGAGDLTMQNGKISLTLADTFTDTQMTSSKGKPINFGFSNQTDAFDWINMPTVTYNEPVGESAWNHQSVKFDTLIIDQISDIVSRVIAKGNCDTIPLDIKTTYEIYPNKTWISVVSEFTNTRDTDISVWLSDIMDLDEVGEKGFYPAEDGVITLTNNNPSATYNPIQPWMGMYGTVSNQSFGFVYSGDFADKMTLYGCQRWVQARKLVTITAGSTYVMSRKLVAVETLDGEDRANSFLNFYNSNFRSNMQLSTEFGISANRPQAGESIQVSYTITNNSATDTYKDISARIRLPFNFTTKEDLEKNIDSIQAGQTKTLEWNIHVIEGGGNRIVNGVLFVGEELLNNARKQVFVSGKGWYAGDNHTHSRHSDGSATIAENLTSAKNKGLSFVSCTDHNKVSQNSDIETYNKANDDIIGVLGNEVSISGVGHIVALFTNTVIPYTNITSFEKAQEVIDNIEKGNNDKGLAFIAHPYYPGLSWKYQEVTNMRGFEVWNGFYKPKHSVNSRAFKLWDNCNVRDGGLYLGLAASDGHNSGKLGDPHIRVLCEEFTEEAYRKNITLGHFYGTDGPDLRFKIGNKIMGDSIFVYQSGSNIQLDIQAMNAAGIDSIRVIKNGELIIKEKVNGDTDLLKTYNATAMPGDFFRVEVDGKDATFAFSNPIFVRKTTSTEIENVQNSMFRVYYDSVTGSLQITSFEDLSLSVKLISVSGVVIRQEFIDTKGTHTLPLRDVDKGVYLVNINNVIKKIVVK